MAEKLPLHSEIPVELTWDLTPLYPDDDAFEKDFAKIAPLAEKLGRYKGRLGESPALLAQIIGEMDDFSRLVEKLGTFAHLRSDEDTGNSANRARADRLSAKLAELSEVTAYFEPELMAIDEATMRHFLVSGDLAFYRRSLEELLREKPHILSEPEERVIGLYSDVLGGADEAYRALSDADMEFGFITAANGKRVQLSHGNYHRFLESKNRRVRRAAFKMMFGTYRKFRTTYALTLDTTIKRHVVSAKLRHYPSALAAALSEDEIPESLYTGLIDAVHANLCSLGDYLELRRKALHLRKLEMHDLFVPLAETVERCFTYEEAKDLVLKSLAPMGEEYCSTVRRAFAERWVDVMECKGKRSGAYSGGCYDSAPYLLLNFNGTLDSVFTLAHEMGHSMHSYYSNHTQKYHYADYSIFVAEVASITNEMLLLEYFLKHSDDENMRNALLVHFCDEVRTTLYRQTMFAEFELKIHQLSAQGVPLSADKLDQLYYELNDLYHDHRIKADALIGCEWARIPHFYYDFYVYKYATGMAAAIALSRNLLSRDAEKRDAYFGFLKAGDSLPPLEILRNAGVDLLTKEPVNCALARFREVVQLLASSAAK